LLEIRAETQDWIFLTIVCVLVSFVI